MGLDATVRCRCFEEGKLKPGPVPVEDLYIDEDGYLSSKTLDEAYRKYDTRRFYARYDGLERAFDAWLSDCCDHEDGEYCSERVSNWTGCAQFCSLVKEAGGEARFPLLSKLLPDGNGGIYPVEKARAALAELDEFIEVVSNTSQWPFPDREPESILSEGRYWTAERIRELLVASIATGNPIRWC